MPVFSHRVLAPVAALICYLLLRQADVGHPIAWTATVTLLTAWWWISEALPIPVTSLLPFVLLPAGGIIDYKQASAAPNIITAIAQDDTSTTGKVLSSTHISFLWTNAAAVSWSESTNPGKHTSHTSCKRPRPHPNRWKTEQSGAVEQFTPDL